MPKIDLKPKQARKVGALLDRDKAVTIEVGSKGEATLTWKGEDPITIGSRGAKK